MKVNEALKAALFPTVWVPREDPLLRGLVLWLRMNEGSGTTVYDASGNGNNGTIFGATWTEDPAGFRCLSFDGANDYVIISNLQQAFTEMTIAAWIKHPSTSWKCVIERNLWNADDGFAIYMTGGGSKASWGHYPGYVTSIKTVQDNTWHHAVGVARLAVGGTIDEEIYIDGAFDNKLSTTRTVFATASLYQPYIGARQGTSYFYNGLIDEVRIYNRALSDAEITELYQRGR